ncbi:MAG: hypothetical protein LUE96_00795 [Lachnospiraceae bacterium]|nr:hypothetical protein [Lachnospiraceae bacterium]
MRNMRNMILMLGAVLWIGALSPEIFISTGAGCIFDEEGNALSLKDAQEFMEQYFYGNEADAGKPQKPELKLGILELLKR